MEILRVENVCYSYKTKYQIVEAVRNVSCSFEKGIFYAIVGESGSGKTTLLSLLAGIDIPSSGTIYFYNKDLSKINRDDYRLSHAAMIYQDFHLFPLLSAFENVMLPMEFKHVPKKEAKERACLLMENIGLQNKIYKQFPPMMSGGEQQRVAIARAIATGGEILLADEPTGNLDSENENVIIELLKKMAHVDKYSVIVVTHALKVAEEADVILHMCDGKMVL